MKDDDQPTPIWSAAIALGKERLATADRSRLLALVFTWVGAIVALKGLREPTPIETSTGLGILFAARGLALGRRIAGFHVMLAISILVLARGVMTGAISTPPRYL